MISEFLETFEAIDTDDLIDFQWKCFIEDMINDDPVIGISMWRSLLDTAGSSLQTDDALAEELLPDFVDSAWMYGRDVSHLIPFVKALDAPAFVEQVFQSAGKPCIRESLLKACHICVRQDLEQLCLNAGEAD